MRAQSIVLSVSLSLAALLSACSTTSDQHTARAAQPDREPVTLDKAPAIVQGDTFNYTYSRNGVSNQPVTEKVTQVSADSIELSTSTPERTYMSVLDRDTLAVRKAMCLSNGQQCDFTPSIGWLRFPLSVGQEWQTEFDVVGETFVAHVVQKWRVAGMERVKVKGGEFDAYRLQSSGSINGKGNDGKPFAGTESATCWSSPAAKMFCVKYAYKNSFGEKSGREVVSLALQ